MSFPRYPAYKDSGVEWLGQVPEHWKLDRMKWSTVSRKNGVWGDEAQQDENDIPCVRVADFDRQKLHVTLSDPTIRNVLPKDRTGRVLSHGDLLLEKSGGGETKPVGCVVIYEDRVPAVCSNFVARVTLAEAMSASYWRYLHFAAYAVRLNTRSIKQTSGIQNLDDQQYFDERCVFPPVDDQVKIAAFLDHETAKIDALIAEQQRLIELLNEKRQAVISDAVTKGLNPQAAMKSSGVKWLGDVPEHWEVRKLSQIFSAKKGRSAQQLTKEFCATNPGDFPVYSGQTENMGVMGTWNQYEFDVGDERVIFTTTVGSGKVMSLRLIGGKFSLSQNCMIIQSKSKLSHTEFFFFHFEPLFEHQRGLIPQHMQASFRMEDLYQCRIAVPPAVEQAEIADYLASRIHRFDDLAADAQRTIDLLQERRSALISAAVTGQIDVRGFMAQVAA